MAVEIGAILEGKVTGITNFGAFVEFPDKTTGMVHISEVSSSFIKDSSVKQDILDSALYTLVSARNYLRSASTSSSLTKLILIDALKDFHNEYPNINIDITKAKMILGL